MSRATSIEALEKGHVKRTAVTLSGWALINLSFQGLGIIYSDIGTSPLYALAGIYSSSGPLPSKEDVIGLISAIVWALTLLPLVKYVIISLYFGTSEGEGGTFALYQGLYPPEDLDQDSDRTLTGDSLGRASSFRNLELHLTRKLKFPMLVWCLFGTSLTMADGVFTPAVSVTSAVAGIGVVKPSVNSDVTGISIAILVVLFLAQHFGTAKIGFVYAPIALIWFIILAVSGIYNITYYPGIWRAFDPSRAVLLFVRTRDYDLLSGVLLALTGCEAVFANLGQFNALSIRLAFTFIVYPSIVLAYLGQGARLIHDPEAVMSNIFYETIPGPQNGGFYWFVFVFALLATIVASQSMITATFSLVQQLINMKSLPYLRMVHTSETLEGQIFVPSANWIVMIIVVIVVAAFKNSTNLSNAYGFAVATVMFSTTILLALQMRYVKHLPIIVGVAYLVVFGFFDALFWGASLRKVPRGAWVPLMIGCILTIFMLFWTWAKHREDKFDDENRMNLRHFIIPRESLEERAPHPPTLTLASSPLAPGGEVTEESESEDGDRMSSVRSAARSTAYYYVDAPDRRSAAQGAPQGELKELARIPTCAIFHKISRRKGVPHTFVGFIRQWPALPRLVIFLSMRVLPINHVRPDDRYVVDKVRTVEGFYGVSYNIGFRDQVEVKIDELVELICKLEMRHDDKMSLSRIDEIRRVSTKATHIVPHYHVVSRKVPGGRLSAGVNWIRAFLLEAIYRRLVVMFPETVNWMTSADEIIYVGVNAEI